MKMAGFSVQNQGQRIFPLGSVAWIIKCIPNGKIPWMASPEGAIYRAGSLTLSLDSISACHVSNPERVIQHKVLWSEVPLDTIDASLQPTAFKHAPPNMRIVNMSTVHRWAKNYPEY